MENSPKTEELWDNKQRTGNIGLYYAAYKLSWYNWNVLITHRNSRGADILAYKEDDTFHTVQVKTMTKKYDINMGKSVNSTLRPKILSDIWVFVFIDKHNPNTNPLCYVLSKEDVENNTFPDNNPGKEGRYIWWLQPKSFMKEEYKENWGIFS